MEDYKKKYELLYLASSKAIEALQNALIDIENMSMSAKEELLPGYLEDSDYGVKSIEEKE